jgi:hypothetical protein
MAREERAKAPVPRSDVSFRLDQKTGNFKGAKHGSLMQWSGSTEGKQKNELAQTEYRFIKTIIIIRGGNYPIAFAFTSALHCSKRRQISRWPWRAELCSGVHCLKETKESTCRMKKMKINEGQRGAGGNYTKHCLLTASASAIT